MNITEKLSQIKKLLFDTATPVPPVQQAYTPAPPKPAAAVPPAPVAPVAAAVPPVPAAPAAPVDYTLLDGSKVSCTSLAVGGDVLVNGVPAPAGTYVFSDNSSIVVDDNGKISQLIPAPVVGPEDTIEDMATPQQMMAAMQKFVAGTPDINSLTLMVKALMNYCFGYDIRRAQEQADSAAAIAAYQSTVAPALADMTMMKSQFEAFKAAHEPAMKLLFETVAEVSGKPTGALPEPPKMKFAHLEPTKPGAKGEKFAETHQRYLDSLKKTA